MSIDVHKKYFQMNFHSSQRRPEDFGLIPSPNENGMYISQNDGSEWIQRDLYDLGWGNEYGFMRWPKLEFQELWELLVNSDLQDNLYGSAYILETEYPDQLLGLLLNIFKDPQWEISPSLKLAFQILDLKRGVNRSSLLGKHYTVIDADFDKWKFISRKVREILG